MPPKKKADSVVPEIRLTIDEIASMINKEMKGNFIVRASETRQEVTHTTTGVLGYDLALGGGYAVNQWNEIVGEESSGKTALAYHTIAVNQRLDPEFLALWVAAEEYVPEYAESFGVDVDRLWVVETNEMEKALDLVIKAVANRAIDMVVIDSIPALVTIAETDAAADEMKVAPGARILSTFFKKCAVAQRRSLVDPDDRPCTLIAINQWRDKIGVMFGDPRTTPGGKAKNYFFFTRIEVRRDEWVQENKSDIDTRVGQIIKMRVMKNKTYRPQQSAEVTMYFADTDVFGFKMGQFDNVKDIVNVALALELFDPGTRYKFRGEKVGGSKDELFARVREDIGLQNDLIEAAHTAMFESKMTNVVPTDEDFAIDFADELDLDNPDGVTLPNLLRGDS